LPKNLESWARSKTETARWLVALHRAASKVGSSWNPVLVAGEPPLTQVVVDRYGDYLELMLDLSISGGFNGPQRLVLQDYLVKEWKRMDGETKQGFLGDLKRWSEAAAKGGAELSEWRKALQPKVLTELHLARANPRCRWLLELYNRERHLYKQKIADLKRRHDKVMDLLDAWPDGKGGGYYEYNPNTRKYDRWVKP
jgi:hypothetical protein